MGPFFRTLYIIHREIPGTRPIDAYICKGVRDTWKHRRGWASTYAPEQAHLFETKASADSVRSGVCWHDWKVTEVQVKVTPVGTPVSTPTVTEALPA